MKSEQLKRANKAVYPVLLSVMIYLFLMMILGMSGILGVTWRTITQFVASGVGGVVISVFYFTKKDKKEGAVGMIFTATIVFMIVRLVGTVMDSWVYALPILFCVMVYLDKTMIVWENVICIICNVIAFVLNLSQINTNAGTTMVISILFSAIIAFATIKITGLLIRFNVENMGAVSETANKQKASNEKMVHVADTIIKYFDDGMTMLNTLQASLDKSNFSMKNIADSTEATAESIQTQAVMCTEIEGATDRAEKVSSDMIQASDRVEHTIESIEKEMQELKTQAENVESASKITVDVVEELTEKVQEVENFVGTILSISSQTNLLALNASIEAARAGVAGKGFAVVADEIRTLSEQTKNASNNITSIIQELMGGTQRANESISNSVQSVSYQNELIMKTRNEVGQVVKEMDELSTGIKSTEDSMKEIIKYSGIISDNISQLSATSEQVAASSNEGLEHSEITVSEVAKCNEIFNSIYVFEEYSVGRKDIRSQFFAFKISRNY